MSELLKKQNYGVEVEFTGITRAMAAKAVAEVIGSTVTGPDHTCYHTRIIRDSQGRKWKIMRDSSIIPVRKTGNALNLHSFFQKGTVEFRLFNSTLHAGKIKAYVQFCLALSAWAIESDDKVVFRSMNGYTAQKKITLMYNILTNRLGLYGDEFKTCRLHMMKQLRENAKAEQVA